MREANPNSRDITIRYKGNLKNGNDPLAKLTTTTTTTIYFSLIKFNWKLFT